MPRKTGLAIVSERAATDEEMALSSAVALDHAQRAETVPPSDIVEELRRQNAEIGRIASVAISERDAAASRVAAAEASASSAAKEVRDIQARADAAVSAVKRQVKTAETVVALRQAAGTVGTALAFLADRTPAVLALLGAYLLARDVLPHPEPLQLVALATFGVVGVLPAVWLSIRRS